MIVSGDGLVIKGGGQRGLSLRYIWTTRARSLLAAICGLGCLTPGNNVQDLTLACQWSIQATNQKLARQS